MAAVLKTFSPLRLPSSLRLQLYSSLNPFTTQKRTYYSPETPEEPLYSAPQAQILSSALSHVPTSGFTLDALRQGLADNSYAPAALNLFPRGEFDLVMYHLRTQRVALQDRVQFPSDRTGPGSAGHPGSEADLGAGQQGHGHGHGHGHGPPADVRARVRTLVLARLQANIDTGVAGQLHSALAHMSLAGNLGASLRELGLLSDEIWFRAGDAAVDAAGWYGKRAGLAAVYAAAEVFQASDGSVDCRDTREFVDRRLEEVGAVGVAAGNVLEWAGFQGVAAVNLARSLGVRI